MIKKFAPALSQQNICAAQQLPYTNGFFLTKRISFKILCGLTILLRFKMDGESKKKPNTLPIWGNERTMNLNTMILTNIQGSPYFKNTLYELKTYHGVVDEIYYKVDHLEPWERGSRKTSGQVGMCGGVRGVGAGGIISTAFCLLYKLFTLRLTRKQLNGLINHSDSPYIRGLGFMYIRFSQPPSDLWEWYEPFLEDEEEIDPKAGGGCTITIGQMVRSFMLKLDWYDSLFPRIPVPIQKQINGKLQALNLCDDRKRKADEGFGEAERYSKMMREKEGEKSPSRSESKKSGRSRSSSRDGKRRRSRERSPRRRSPGRRRKSHERKRSRDGNGRDKRSRSRERQRDRRSEGRKDSHDRSCR